MRDPFQVGSGVSTPMDSYSVSTTRMRMAVFQSAQLLQAFGPLQGADRQVRITEQKIAPVDIAGRCV